MATEVCLNCARSRRAGEWSCPGCGCDSYGERISTDTGPAGDEGALPLGGLLAGLVNLPPGKLALMHGPKGWGKTTIAFQAFDHPWIVSNESAIGLVRAYCRRLGVRYAGISTTKLIEEPDQPVMVDFDLPDEVPREIVLDSTTIGEPALTLRALKALRDLCELHGSRAIAIAQVTSDGEARGGPQIQHLPDVVIRLEAVEGTRQLVVEKNRFGPEGIRSYELTAEGARLPTRTAYYTVEGTAPRFRLLQHPHPQARYNGLYRAVERLLQKDQPVPHSLRLPPPPLATAALESVLYPSGLVEPEDVAARRRFAEDHGVTFFSPRGA